MERSQIKKGKFYYATGRHRDGERMFLKKTEADIYNAYFRHNACWMSCKITNLSEDIPEETQFLLTKKQDVYTVYFALATSACRSSLYGTKEGLYVLMETGEDGLEFSDTPVCFEIEGKNVYRIIADGFSQICKKLKTFRLKKEKTVPDFVNKIGFCTYNAFGLKFDHDKLVEYVKQWQGQGITPGYILLDAGWQEYNANKIASFEEDKTKFPHGLQGFVDDLHKLDENIEVFCWHTYNGFWRGVDKNGKFPHFSFTDKMYRIPEHIRRIKTEPESANPATAGNNFINMSLKNELTTFPREDLFRFYFDFYAYLRQNGVTGSKLDAMAWIEFFAEGKGGRVRFMQELISALEASSATHFHYQHINCSSLSNDFLYNTMLSGVTRSSSDYFPDVHPSHGYHIATNAMVSLLLDEVLICDWDMFMSGGDGGEMHAMSRAISGGPIYCTDSPEKIRFDILRRLCTSDGKVPRCLMAAKPTEDCLFYRYAEDNILFKIFNRNRYGCVLGIFNCNPQRQITDKIELRGIEGLREGKYAIYSFRKGFIGVYGCDFSMSYTMNSYESDILQIVPLSDGFSVLGMTEYYNGGAFVKEIRKGENELQVLTMEAGELLVYAEGEICCSHPCKAENGLLRIRSDGDWITIARK